VRLEHLADMELRYTTGFWLARPYGSEEGSGYGEGEGSVTGRIEGSVRWVNHPHRRSDGTMLPDAHGVITTDAGAHIHFSLSGRTQFVGKTGIQLLTVLFETEDDDHRWLNTSLHVLEGVVDEKAMSMRARIFTCVHELAASAP
jgi:hypothetical protein